VAGICDEQDAVTGLEPTGVPDPGWEPDVALDGDVVGSAVVGVDQDQAVDGADAQRLAGSPAERAQARLNPHARDVAGVHQNCVRGAS
jgi:hypothetical protein